MIRNLNCFKVLIGAIIFWAVCSVPAHAYTYYRSSTFATYRTGQIDPANGFAYFADQAAHEVIKLRLSDMAVVDTLVIASTHTLLMSAIDLNAGFLYVGSGAFGNDPSGPDTNTILKIDLTNFTLVGEVPITIGGNSATLSYIFNLAIDPSAGFLYVSAVDSSAPYYEVIKFDLNSFTEVNELPLQPGEIFNLTIYFSHTPDYTPSAAIIDSAGGYGYFSVLDSNFMSKIVKIRLSDFTRLDTLPLGINEAITAASFDSSRGLTYWVGRNIHQVDLASFAVVSSTNIESPSTIPPAYTNHQTFAAVVDPTTGIAYWGNGAMVATAGISKLFSTQFQSAAIQGYTISLGPDSIESAVIDPVNQFIYYGSTGNQDENMVFTNGGVYKVAFSELAPASPFPSPQPPSNLIATAGDLGQTNLAWTGSTGAQSYNIYTSSVGLNVLVTGGVITTKSSVAGIIIGQSYFVTAVDENGESGLSTSARIPFGGGGGGGTGSAPQITQNPVSIRVAPGPASFSVAATGSNLTYQWQRGSINITGATSATYSFASTLADNGVKFRCIVSNSFGSVTSAAATLTVSLTAPPGSPTIATQPSDQRVQPGPVTFRVVASGIGPFSYQWRRESTDIPAATASSYAFVATLADNGAHFQCAVTNALGSTLSAAVTLTMIPTPRVYPNPWRGDRDSGRPITIDQVTAGSEIKIFTLSGHWVKTLSPSSTSTTWLLDNDAGEKVSSGYYLYVVTTADKGQQTGGKIAIIK